MTEEKERRGPNFRVRFIVLGIICGLLLAWAWNIDLFARVKSQTAWIDDLSSPDARVRCRAIQALGVLCEPRSQDASLLLETFLKVARTDKGMCDQWVLPDLPIRYHAGEALGCFVGEEAVLVLIEYLKRMPPGEEDIGVIEMLGENGTFAGNALPVLEEMAAPSSPASDSAKKYARRAIEEIEGALKRQQAWKSDQ